MMTILKFIMSKRASNISFSALYQLDDGQPDTRGEPELLEASGVVSPVGEYEEQSNEEDEVDIGDLHVD
jgi:hypothetical protein